MKRHLKSHKVKLGKALVAQRKSERLLTVRSQVQILPRAPKLKKEERQIRGD